MLPFFAPRPAPALAGVVPTQQPVYPALARRLLAGTLDLLLCGWLFLLAVALVHLSSAGTPLAAEQLLPQTLAFSALLFLGYFALTEGSREQASLGKRLLGLKVVRRDGSAPGLHDMVLRFVLTVAGLATGGLLFLTALRSRQGRCLQDRLSGTLVVTRGASVGQLRLHPRVPHAGDERGSLLFCLGLLWLATQVAWPWWQDTAVALRVDRAVRAAKPVSSAAASRINLARQLPLRPAALGEAVSLLDGDATVERLYADGSVDLRLHFAPVDGAVLRLKMVDPAVATPVVHCLALDLPSAYTPRRCRAAGSTS